MPSVCSAIITGGRARVVSVACDVDDFLPEVIMTGVPGRSTRELRDRVRAAMLNSGLRWPGGKVTVTVSPACLPPRVSCLDLAVAILAADASVPAGPASGVLFYAETGLDGTLRGVPGARAAAVAAVEAGCRAMVVARDEPAWDDPVPGLKLISAMSLHQVVTWLRSCPEPAHVSLAGFRPVPDMATLPGNWQARAAAEVCAAGGHSLSVLGPPGTGADLAERLPGLLPRLDDDEAAEVTRLHAACGMIPADVPLVREPPLACPPTQGSLAQMLGSPSGGPGWASLAHRGVLLLDHAPEFPQIVLDALRQPLEHGDVILARGSGRDPVTYPARFLLVVTASPCPCTALGTPERDCQCTPAVRRRYLGRLSGPLLDRIAVKTRTGIPSERPPGHPGTTSAVIAGRVRAARDRAARRLAGTGWRVNADVPAEALHAYPAHPGALGPLDRATEVGALSRRGAAHVLRVAWTIADLHAHDQPTHDDMLTALAYFQGDHQWLSNQH